MFIKNMVRKEYKLWIYANYFLPSKRFLLTVHTLTQTQLKTLDTLTDKAIKIWAGVPRSATNAVIHMKEALDIKSISQLYTVRLTQLAMSFALTPLVKIGENSKKTYFSDF